MNTFISKYIKWISLLIDLITADLLTKWLVRTHLPQAIDLIPGYLQLRTSYNPGIAWSIPIPSIVMVLITPFLLGGITYHLFKSCNIDYWATKLVAVLFIAGGLGNLYDRVVHGVVTDFIAPSFFPTFNLADTYLTLAAFLLIVFYGKITRRNYGDSSTATSR